MTNPILPNETLPVNEDNKDSVTIQRGKHDKENPYVLISRKMLRDTSISPKSKGVLCYLLSLPDNWKAHPKHVAKSLGVSKDQIYTVLKELISAGYAKRTESKGEKGKFGFVLYEFYEEKLETPQENKEKTTVAGFPDTGSPDTGKPPLRYIDTKIYGAEESSLKVPAQENAAKAAEVEKSKSSKSKREKPDFSPKIREIANLMVNTLHEANPLWLIPKNLHSMMVEIEKMICEEGRDPKIIVDVFMWAVADSFWMTKLCKPNPAKYLQSQFGQLGGRMNEKPPKNPNDVDRRLRDKEGNTVDDYKDRMF